MSLTTQTIGDIFGLDSTKTEDHDDPSSDYSAVVDWMAEQINCTSTHIPEPPLRVNKALRAIGGCNDWLFSKFKAMVRSRLNHVGDAVLLDGIQKLQADDSSATTSEVILIQLFNSILNLSGLLHECYTFLSLDSTQIRLMERLENAMFQTWVNNKSVFEQIRRVYEQYLLRNMATSADTTSKMSDILYKIDLGSELTLLLLETSRKRLQQYVGESCARQWSQPRLSQLLKWVKGELFPCITGLVPTNELNVDCLIDMAKLELARLRTVEIFDMVLDFPNSTRGLEEFRECLTSIEQGNELVERFIGESRVRLLHAGTSTVSIIKCYISTVRAFLIIDHRGVLLDKASRPIRNYLKIQKDTIPCIVHALLDKTQGNKLIELARELRNGPRSGNQGSSEDIVRDLNWVPDPVDALPDFRKAVVEDIVESLISIFDSTEPFVDEFVKVFSNRLLDVTDYQVKEIHTDIRLLKARFDGQEFGKLDVMLKDVLQSKTLDTTLKPQKPRDVHALIISHLYWPELPSASFILPGPMQRRLEEYKRAYEARKSGRKVDLCPSLTKADLNIEVGGVSRNFVVTADRAAIIYFFLDQPVGAPVKLAIVCMRLKMPLQLAKDGLKYWVQQGVLDEVGLNTYCSRE